MSMVEMRQALNVVTMKNDDDPERLFEGLNEVCNQFKTTTFKLQMKI